MNLIATKSRSGHPPNVVPDFASTPTLFFSKTVKKTPPKGRIFNGEKGYKSPSRTRQPKPAAPFPPTKLHRKLLTPLPQKRAHTKPNPKNKMEPFCFKSRSHNSAPKDVPKRVKSHRFAKANATEDFLHRILIGGFQATIHTPVTRSSTVTAPLGVQTRSTDRCLRRLFTLCTSTNSNRFFAEFRPSKRPKNNAKTTEKPMQRGRSH